MKCNKCGADVGENQATCQVCGAYLSTMGIQVPEDNNKGIVREDAQQKTKSRAVALMLAFIGANDLYLLEFRRLFLKVLVFIFTVGIGYLIWQVADIIRIATGSISCDRNGVPLVW